MELTILGLVRPQLNLSKNFNQAAHLIEHILLSPERQKAMGLTDKDFSENIIACNGWTSELFCLEYYIVKKSAVEHIKNILLENSQNLYLNKMDFEKHKNILIQELIERKTDSPSRAWVWESSIYTKDSPALGQPWFNDSSLKNITPQEVELIFKTHGESQLIELSYESFQVPNIKIDKNHLLERREITINHPSQPSNTTEINILIPFEISPEQTSYINLFINSFSDNRFGLINTFLRHKKGFIYTFAAFYNVYANAFQINATCHRENVDECLSYLNESIASYPTLLKDMLPFITQRLINTLELEWGNISDAALPYLESVILGNLNLDPKTRIQELRSLDIQKLENLHKKILEHYKSSSLTVTINN